MEYMYVVIGLESIASCWSKIFSNSKMNRGMEIRMNNMLLENINTNEMVGFEVVDDYFSGAHNYYNWIVQVGYLVNKASVTAGVVTILTNRIGV